MRRLVKFLAGGWALLAHTPAHAITVAFDARTTEGEELVVSVSTDDRNLGHDQPAYLSLFEVTVRVGDDIYSINQSIFSAFEWGRGASARLDDAITRGTLAGNELSFVATAGTWSNYIPGRSGMLSDITLQFAEDFEGPLTLDTVFNYLGGTTLTGAFGRSNNAAFRMAELDEFEKAAAVPVPPAAVLFWSGMALFARRRALVELGGIEPPTS